MTRENDFPGKIPDEILKHLMTELNSGDEKRAKHAAIALEAIVNYGVGGFTWDPEDSNRVIPLRKRNQFDID